jgi:hypothetical protein
MLVLWGVCMVTDTAAAVRYHRYSRHRHHHHHSHVRSFFGFGLGFYGYPYSPYYYPDYYSGYYAPYYPYQPYESGEYRRFPAFKLPGFFQYPGALGKGEAESQSYQDLLPEAEIRLGPETLPPGRREQ